MNRIYLNEIVVVCQYLDEVDIVNITEDCNIKVVIFSGPATTDICTIERMKKSGIIVDICDTLMDVLGNIHVYLNMYKYKISTRYRLYASHVNGIIAKKETSAIITTYKISDELEFTLAVNDILYVYTDTLTDANVYIDTVNKLKKQVGCVNDILDIPTVLRDCVVIPKMRLEDIKFGCNKSINDDTDSEDDYQTKFNSPLVLNNEIQTVFNGLSDVFNIVSTLTIEQDLYDYLLKEIKSADLIKFKKLIFVISSYKNISTEFMLEVMDKLKPHTQLKLTKGMLKMISSCIDPIKILEEYNIVNIYNILYLGTIIKNIPVRLIPEKDMPNIQMNAIYNIDWSDINKYRDIIYTNPELTTHIVDMMIDCMDDMNHTIISEFINNIPYIIHSGINPSHYSECLAELGVVNKFVYINRKNIIMIEYLTRMKSMDISYFKKFVDIDIITEYYMDHILNNKNLTDTNRCELSTLWNNK